MNKHKRVLGATGRRGWDEQKRQRGLETRKVGATEIKNTFREKYVKEFSSRKKVNVAHMYFLSKTQSDEINVAAFI